MKRLWQKKGSVLVMVFMFSILLSGIVTSYMSMVSVLSKATSYKMNRYQAVYIAEAGIDRIAWYLRNTAPNGTTDGSWRGVRNTETLGGFTYIASAGDILLEGPVITASSEAVGHEAGDAMDKDIDTYWRSVAGQGVLTFFLARNGDYTIYVTRTRMRVVPTVANGALAAQFPVNYTWDVSTNGITWTQVVNKNGNTNTDVTDTFMNGAVIPNTLYQANYLRLTVTSPLPVNIAEVEIFGVVAPATVSATSEQGIYTASLAVDNSISANSYWQSTDNVSDLLPQTFTIVFPPNADYSVSSVRMRLGAAPAGQFPKAYTWQVSTDNGAIWNTVVTVVNNASTDVTDTFTVQTNVDRIRVNVTEVQNPASPVSIGEIDVPAACLSSVCSIAYPGARAISYWASQNVTVNGVPPSISRHPDGNFEVESGQ